MKDSRLSLKFFALISLIVINYPIHAQHESPEWFAKNCVFPMLEYDLLEVQPYTGVFFLNAELENYEGVYIPVNIGFRKSFIQWDMGSIRFDLAIGVATYTQFEITRFDENTFRGGLLNTDFKASGFLFASIERHKFRMQLFHISSHLGDDYLLRNQDFELNDKSVNYEQIDITYLYSFPNTDFYTGVGFVITPNSFRERFMIQCGFQATIPLKPKLDMAYGADIKLYEENEYSPDIHAEIGISIKQREQQQINFSIDAYLGKLPYSTLKFGQVYWIGLSTRIYL